MMADLIRCACTRLNDPWRRYCNGCGRHLDPACRCGFVNAKADQFCGGCGSRVSQASRAGEHDRTQPIDIVEVIR